MFKMLSITQCIQTENPMSRIEDEVAMMMAEDGVVGDIVDSGCTVQCRR